jgi:hypothetical protein
LLDTNFFPSSFKFSPPGVRSGLIAFLAVGQGGQHGHAETY